MFITAQVGRPVRCTARLRRHMTRFWFYVVRTGQDVEGTLFAVTPAQGKCYSARLKFNIKALNFEIHPKDTERFNFFITASTLQLFNKDLVFNL
jgi:hypothetical protein